MLYFISIIMITKISLTNYIILIDTKKIYEIYTKLFIDLDQFQ